MNNEIIEPTIDYDFSKLYLGPPSTLAGGSYFTRIMHGSNKTLYIQTPKTLTKQGFIKSGKKIYTDIMLDNNDTVFINWIENLETRCQDLIFSKGQSWFETKLEKDDIEAAFTSSFKIFKSGKYYLLRVNVKPNIKIYDETDKILTFEDITLEKTIISILEIQGIKFTSKNFQIEFELKQTMLVSPDPFLDECFIKRPIKSKQQYDSINELIEDSASELTKKNNKEIDLEINFEDTKPVVKEDVKPVVKEDNLKEVILSNDEDSINLNIEDLTINNDDNDNNNDQLKEFDIFSNLENASETITLKKPNQVYYEIYMQAREKAKNAKKEAIQAYLEMKNIKKTYMLDDIDNSDSEFEDLENDLEEI